MTLKSPSLARITITLPQSTLQEADRAAKHLDRSRSWVIAEAIRRYVAGVADTAGRSTRSVGEPPAPRYGAVVPGLGPERQRQLEADLRLTPTQRVKEAEEQLRLAAQVRPRASAARLLAFDHYQDYLDWQRREGSILL